MYLESEQNIFKYYFRVDTIIVHADITRDLKKECIRLQKLGVYTLYKGRRLQWKQGIIEQVGGKTNQIEALRWKKEIERTLNLEKEKGHPMDARR